jgi:CRISPR-associated protein (TIGR03986 family)
MEVKSVYNFVPAPEEKEVFKPDWADKVSHDIPFEDGESGEIELTITAKSPIFIRNGHSKQDEENNTQRYQEFSNIERNGNKEYFIPGSSLKGMFRNVLEIMSFSRLKTANDIFAYRDMASRQSEFKKEVALNKNLKTGWLEKVNDLWVIKGCDYGRIDFQRWNRAEKSVVEKYTEYFNRNQSLESFEFVDELDNNRGKVYRNVQNGSFKAYQVFFGSMKNKKYEYIFTEPISEKEYDVNIKLINKFKDIDKKLDNTQWQYLTSSKNPYPNKRIPVFFKEKDGTVEHFGFSRLYKMSNTKYLNEMNPLASYYNRDDEYEFDLADTIFGTVEDTNEKHGKNRNKKSLKGRVFIGHAFGMGQIIPNSPVDLVLGGPKASYYPFYIKDGKTYLNENAELKGYKKYPVHSDNSIKSSNLSSENTEIQTQITPLPSETKFVGKIRFFNLKKAEIGALLSAITLHNHNNVLNHNLGSAKPFGFGKVSIKASLDSKYKYNSVDYLVSFEEEITKQLKEKGIDWIKSDALKELYAMTKDPLKEMLLKYPELELKGKLARDANEFNNYRQEGLKAYSNNLNESFSGIAEKRKREIELLEEEKIKKELLAKEIAKQEAIEKLQREQEEKLKQHQESNLQAFDKISNEGYAFLMDEIDFNSGRNKIEKFKKKVPICENDIPIIKDFVFRFFDATQKDWNNFKRGANWKKIIGWIGKDKAKQWYDELMK